MPKHSDTAKVLGAGAVFTAVGGAYKLSEFLYKAKRLRDVGPSNAVYVRLINRVRADLDEVKRLLTVPEVEEALADNRPKAKWVHGAMRDVRGALENITPLTERVGGDVKDGRRVGIRHRIYWLLSEKEKLENREKELNVAHASLTEVIGFLTALEPLEEKKKHVDRKVEIEVGKEPHRHERVEHRETWVEHGVAPQRVEEREVWVEHDQRGPTKRVEEREVWIEHGRDPRKHEHEIRVGHRHEPHGSERDIRIERRHQPHLHEHEIRVEHGHDPRQVQERETWVEEHGPRYEAKYYEDRHYDGRPGQVEERELHVQRDPRDPRHVEAQYVEKGPGYYDEKHYEERRFDDRGPPPRRSTDEDRVPERSTFMQSEAWKSRYGPYGEYAEYGAPQPSGAASYRSSRVVGDLGFGDEEVLNPQPVPALDRGYDRQSEVWVEQKEDYRYDQYGNRIPDHLHQTRYPRSHARSRL
ncbi:hypothetical protein P154DRAFT_521113 [Amniculicola lignicola CBS 123094]|uniref:Uncharacterized protein n=1 Tax=Amniculicola lignicola CBS 123094 TaxID=1392246 RepID=A0A6A5WXC1_9PLEO|nr:hypothetical protein P154DRAFT_521113 [Amniculicola lignicola CBS 123094]